MDNRMKRLDQLATSVQGMYQRRARGELTGRNSASSEATLAWRVGQLRELRDELAKDGTLDDLGAAGNRMAERVSRLERRYYGLS